MLTAILAGVEQAINPVLRLDPEVAGELFKLHGKVIQFRFTDLGFDVFVRIQRDRLALAPIFGGEPDTRLTGSSLTFLKTYQQGFSVGSDLKIAGELEVAEEFSAQLQRFTIDWEELLSKVMGDIAAHKVHGAVSDLLAWGADSVERARMDTSEYVHEEIRITPPKAELEDFYAEIAKVRDGVERAQARVERLLNHWEA